MNDLRVITVGTDTATVFETYWMTGLVQKGRVRVTVPWFHDSRTAAELAAIEYLLVSKNVCGHHKAGGGLRLYVSSAAILELVEGRAPKGYLAPYANFLRTRFLGAEVHLGEGDAPWVAEARQSEGDALDIDTPATTVIGVNGVGEVELTAHAVEQYVERFERRPERAWRELIRIGQDARPATLAQRCALADVKHRRPGLYALDTKRSVMLVIAQPDGLGKLPRLVTVVRPGPHARVVLPGLAR